MSSPPVKYLRYFDFTTFATNNPEKPLPGASVDVELNRLKSTTDQTIDRLALIQRDDGHLIDGAITTSSLADGAVTEPKLANLSVSTRTLQDASVTGPKIAPGSLTGAAFAPGSIGSALIQDGGIQTVDLADNSVSTPKLQDASVTAAKHGPLSVATAALQDQSVTQAKHGLLSVGTPQLIDGSITTAKIAPGTVIPGGIPPGYIDNSMMGPLSVGTANLIDASVTLSKMAPNSVASANIVNGSIDPVDLSATTVALMTAAGNPRGAWATGIAYATKDAVTNGNGVFVCITAHVSGVFATDLAAGKWYQTGTIYDQSLNKADAVQFLSTKFGGVTNLFPMLKQIGAVLYVRTADDSADANINAQTGTFSGPLQTAVNNSNDVGAAAARWKKVWAVDGDFSGNLNVGGNLAVTGNITGNFPGVPGANKIINGNFAIDQRNAGVQFNMTGVINQRFSADRWSAILRTNNANSFSIQQYPAGPPYQTCLRVQVLTAGAFADPVDYTGVQYAVEGYDMADANYGVAGLEKQLTLSFMVNANVAGVYGVAFRNTPGTRYICATYTINAINTWEYKTITIPGDPVNAPDPWNKTNSSGLKILWDLGTGATSSKAVAGVWQTGLGLGVTGTQKIVQNNVGGVWVLANVKLELGAVATPFVPDIYEVSLAKCQRYHYRLDVAAVEPVGVFSAYGAANCNGIISHFPTTMRAAPTVTMSGGLVAWNGAQNGNSAFSAFGISAQLDKLRCTTSTLNGGISFGVGDAVYITGGGGASTFYCDAEI